MLQSIKNFGIVAALETLVAVAFLITSGLCLYAEAYDGAAVAGVVSVIAAGLGLWHYRNENMTGPNLTVGLVRRAAAPATFMQYVDAELPKNGKRGLPFKMEKPRKTKPKAKPAKKKLTKRK